MISFDRARSAMTVLSVISSTRAEVGRPWRAEQAGTWSGRAVSSRFVVERLTATAT